MLDQFWLVVRKRSLKRSLPGTDYHFLALIHHIIMSTYYIPGQAWRTEVGHTAPGPDCTELAV